MPIAALPPSNTKRYFIGLVNAGFQHHIQVRCADTVSDSQAVIDLGFVVSTIQPVTAQDYTFNELLVAEHGSDIRNPVAGWEVVPGTVALDQLDVQKPLSLCARGRSTSGRKCKAFLWGQVFTHDADWLFSPDVATPHFDFLTILVTTPSYFLAIDGTKPVWKLDFTVNYNDHWIDRLRP
jgi:hypothetical protein